MVASKSTNPGGHRPRPGSPLPLVDAEVLDPKDYPADAEPHEIRHWEQQRITHQIAEVAERYGLGEYVGQIDTYYQDQFHRDILRKISQAVYDDATGRGQMHQPWDIGTLAEQLERPEPPAARVHGLIPWEASTAIIAQRKTGKTTLVLNLARSLLTGEPFLGMDVREVEGRVAFLNFEVSGHQLARWASEVGVPADRLVVVNLRGASNPFNDPARLAELADQLRDLDVETLIVDPFGRAFSGDNQNDSGQVQSWLVRLDEFARSDVGAKDLILTVHAGWEGTHARGSSALEDWPDSLVYLTRPKGSDDRYISATGRDVDLPEDLLAYDADKRQLSLTGAGSKHGASLRGLAEQAIAVVTDQPGLNTTAIATELKARGASFQKGDPSKALAQAVSRGLLRCESGARGAKNYFLEREDFDDDVI